MAFGRYERFHRTFSTCAKRVYDRMELSKLAENFLPPINRSMRELDRSFFQKTMLLSVATVHDVKNISDVRNSLRRSGELFDRHPIKPMREISGEKAWLLKPTVNANDSSTWSPVLGELVNEGIARVDPFNLQMTYDDWDLPELLDAILPRSSEEEKETPHAFAQVGHVAHINLRTQYLPYKHLIGQILLDKNPQITTVINKVLDVGTESEYRTFPYEVLAGPDDLDVSMTESNCIFRFNFGKVYWNTRLSNEHARMVSKFQPDEAICDVMAGVGPFSIPAGKRGCWVRANDLNPDCYTSLASAAVENKVQERVQPNLMEGKSFIRWAVQDIRQNPRAVIIRPKTKLRRHATAAEKAGFEERMKRQTFEIREPTEFDHFIMNLPATAVNFLHSLKGIYKSRMEEKSTLKMPMVHCYTFQRRIDDDVEEKQEICRTISSKLGVEMRMEDEKHEFDLHFVRLISPSKRMYCASFRLPEEVAFGQEERLISL